MSTTGTDNNQSRPIETNPDMTSRFVDAEKTTEKVETVINKPDSQVPAKDTINE